MRGRRTEEGAGVVLAIGVVLLLVALAVTSAGAVALIAAHRQAQSAADLAALAGAGAVRSGREGCAEAERIAAANGADLTRCASASGVIEVVVDVEVGLVGAWTLSGRARAGPGP